MKRVLLVLFALVVTTDHSPAQEFLIGGPTPGGEEPLYQYDDREPWKHGWFQVIPYYGGYHSFRPYNYKQVYSQSAQAAAWGMPHTMPYSQQFYHRYENLAGHELPDISAIHRSPFGPHPSAMYQPQWNALRRAPIATAGYDHRQGAAMPLPSAPINFQSIHQSPPSGPEFERSAAQHSRNEQLLRATTTQIGPVLHEPLPAPAAPGH